MDEWKVTINGNTVYYGETEVDGGKVESRAKDMFKNMSRKDGDVVQLWRNGILVEH